MARIRLVPTEKLTPGLREIAKGAEAHKLNPAIFRAAGNLPSVYAVSYTHLTLPTILLV